MSGEANACERNAFVAALEALGPLRGIREVVANVGVHASDGATFRGLYVGTSGDVTIETEEGQVITLKSLAAGLWHGVYFRRVVSATAADILVGR